MRGRIEENKALGVLCSDGKRRNARLRREHYVTDSEKIAATVKVQGFTVSGFVLHPSPNPDWQSNPEDLYFVAFQFGRGVELLPARSLEAYAEVFPTVYVVVENTPGYLPEDDEPFTTTNRKQAELVASELAQELREDGGYKTSGSARDGIIYAERKQAVGDLGRVIEIMEVDAAELSEKEREELGL